MHDFAPAEPVEILYLAENPDLGGFPDLSLQGNSLERMNIQ